LRSDVESQGDDHDLIADGARRLAKEQVSKISVAQNAQVRRHHSPSSETATAVAARTAAGAVTQIRGVASIAGPR
jgi:RNA-binding protein YhbY